MTIIRMIITPVLLLIMTIIRFLYEKKGKRAAFYIALKSTGSTLSAYSGSPTGHNQSNISFSTPRGA